MKDKIKLRGLSYKDSLIHIRDARIGGMNYVQIAERLGLDAECVFRAHIKLMKLKLLGWKPETIEHEIEVTDPKTQEITKGIQTETIAVWFIPIQPEKKHRMKFNFSFSLKKKNRGQTKKDASKDEKIKQ